MTPAPKDHHAFEKEAGLRALAYCYGSHEEYTDACRSCASFVSSALWAREETIREVLWLMRDAKSVEFRYLSEWADWLESKLKEPTVVPKDPSFVLPEYY